MTEPMNDFFDYPTRPKPPFPVEQGELPDRLTGCQIQLASPNNKSLTGYLFCGMVNADHGTEDALGSDLLVPAGIQHYETGYAPNPWEAVVRNDDDEHVKSGGRRRRATPWVETEKERMKVSCLRLVEAHCLLLSVLVHGTVVGCVHL
uniref:Uncharacterized protein n=1 Tax=Physcomitrium patens TaxID=3218 RepID=A0A2K1IEI6_PHYPA|nr:hypothetical protein PHYPA_029838 [Physcomitrium patens]PNR27689.1 hypothetical protein PHYPA_029841 [Physcomitrium patens]